MKHKLIKNQMSKHVYSQLRTALLPMGNIRYQIGDGLSEILEIPLWYSVLKQLRNRLWSKK